MTRCPYHPRGLARGIPVSPRHGPTPGVVGLPAVIEERHTFGVAAFRGDAVL
ncbi:MAG: hypothetical protein ACFCGT_01645 [Sandaracinaceae bacterium]